MKSYQAASQWWAQSRQKARHCLDCEEAVAVSQMRRLCKRIEEKYINTDNFSCYSSISFLLAMELFFIYFYFFFHVAVSVVLSHFNQQMAAPTLLLYTCLYGAQQHRRVASVWRCRAKHTPPAKTVSQSSTSLLIFCWIKTRRCPCPYGRTIDQHHQSPPPPISFFYHHVRPMLLCLGDPTPLSTWWCAGQRQFSETPFTLTLPYVCF